MEAQVPLPVKITAAALAEVGHIMTNKNIPAGYALRVGIKGGGCGAVGYMLGFDHEKPGDNSWQVNGITVLVEKRHLMYLLGIVLDFEDTEEQRGFTFVKQDLAQAS